MLQKTHTKLSTSLYDWTSKKSLVSTLETYRKLMVGRAMALFQGQTLPNIKIKYEAHHLKRAQSEAE